MALIPEHGSAKQVAAITGAAAGTVAATVLTGGISLLWSIPLGIYGGFYSTAGAATLAEKCTDSCMDKCKDAGKTAAADTVDRAFEKVITLLMDNKSIMIGFSGFAFAVFATLAQSINGCSTEADLAGFANTCGLFSTVGNIGVVGGCIGVAVTTYNCIK